MPREYNSVYALCAVLKRIITAIHVNSGPYAKDSACHKLTAGYSNFPHSLQQAPQQSFLPLLYSDAA